jgi:hypothetical protein
MEEEIIRRTVSIPMSDFRHAILGGDSVDDARREDRCIQAPIGCGRPLSETIEAKDRLGYTWFRDPTSNSDYKITGLCQACQDRVYGEGEEAMALEAEGAWYDRREAEKGSS